MKSVLTYSALNCYRNCPRKYKLRYIDLLRRPQSPEALMFGDVIHVCLQLWYTLPADGHRLLVFLDLIDTRFPNRVGDPGQKAAWQLARAIMGGYAARYAEEEFEPLHVEKKFDCEIRNPDTGRASQTFTIAGKVDGIVRAGGELYLLEHKTASSLSGDYLDKLWCDTQIALYTFYLRQLGFPIVGVVYNVLLKSRLQQRTGETDAEYAARRAALEHAVAVERKSLPDFVHTVIHDTDRFCVELEKLAGYEAACIVVEADLDRVLRAQEAAALRGARPESVLGAALWLGLTYGVPVFWCGSRQAARAFTDAYLRMFVRLRAEGGVRP